MELFHDAFGVTTPLDDVYYSKKIFFDRFEHNPYARLMLLKMVLSHCLEYFYLYFKTYNDFSD